MRAVPSGLKARPIHRARLRINLFYLPHLFRPWLMWLKISPFYILHFFGPCLRISLFCLPGCRARRAEEKAQAQPIGQARPAQAQQQSAHAVPGPDQISMPRDEPSGRRPLGQQWRAGAPVTPTPGAHIRTHLARELTHSPLFSAASDISHPPSLSLSSSSSSSFVPISASLHSPPPPRWLASSRKP